MMERCGRTGIQLDVVNVDSNGAAGAVALMAAHGLERLAPGACAFRADIAIVDRERRAAVARDPFADFAHDAKGRGRVFHDRASRRIAGKCFIRFAG